MKLLALATGNNLLKIKTQYCEDQIMSVSTVEGAIAALRSAYYDSVIVAGYSQSVTKKLDQFKVPIVYFDEGSTDLAVAEYNSNGQTAIALKSLQRQRDITQLSAKVAVLEHQAEDREDRIQELEKQFDQLERDVYGDAKASGLSDRIRQLENQLQSKEANISKQQDIWHQWKLWAAGALISIMTAGVALVPTFFEGGGNDRSIPSSVRQSAK